MENEIKSTILEAVNGSSEGRLHFGQVVGLPSNGFSSFSHVQPGSNTACIPVVPCFVVMIEIPPAAFMSSMVSGRSKRLVSICADTIVLPSVRSGG